MADLEKAVLAAIGEHGEIADSTRFAQEHGVDHLKLVGVMKSLEAADMIAVSVRATLRTALPQLVPCSTPPHKRKHTCIRL